MKKVPRQTTQAYVASLQSELKRDLMAAFILMEMDVIRAVETGAKDGKTDDEILHEIDSLIGS